MNNKIKSINPATGEVLGEVLNKGKKEIEETLKLAKNAFIPWSKLSFDKRAEYMIKIKNKMIEREDEIIDILVKETGKPKLEALLSDINYSLEDLEYYAKNSEKFLKDEKVGLGIAFKGKKSRVVFEPAGVIGIILPWNFPLVLCFHSMIPALMAGNTVILKPSEHTPLCILLIGEIIKEAGLPNGVVNILTGDGTTGKYLVESDVNRIVFIGSLKTGKKVMKTASQQLHPIVLELGGKDPAIICNDANLDWTSSGIIWGSMLFTGQVCSSIERVYIMEEIANEFIDNVVEKTKKLKVGNGFDLNTEIGPLIAKFQLDKVKKHVEDAKKKGAKILTGGKQLKEKGELFYSPTVLTDVNHDMLIMKEETFGPIIPIMKVKNEEEAIRLANDTKYGLCASVWTSDLDKGGKIAQQLQAGYVCINNRIIENAALPWGGTKNSGFGKISSRYGLLNFVNTKCVTVDKINKIQEDWWFPYNKNKLLYFNKLLANYHSGKIIGKLKAGTSLIQGIKTKEEK
jgi:succinate-semialdehyde dehydrogenase/glutarate-semialdehyde dehydrogenase